MDLFLLARSVMLRKDPEPSRREDLGAGMADRRRRRLDRQLRALALRFPALRGIIGATSAGPAILVRAPLALLFLAGGFLGFLPVLGFWMIPLGLLILAIDLPLLRPAVTAVMIRARRRWTLWRRKSPRALRNRRR